MLCALQMDQAGLIFYPRALVIGIEPLVAAAATAFHCCILNERGFLILPHERKTKTCPARTTFFKIMETPNLPFQLESARAPGRCKGEGLDDLTLGLTKTVGGGSLLCWSRKRRWGLDHWHVPRTSLRTRREGMTFAACCPKLNTPLLAATRRILIDRLTATFLPPSESSWRRTARASPLCRCRRRR